MHYSGILVRARPANLIDTLWDLEAIPGVDVHYCYPESGRLIAVQETQTAEQQESGLRKIQSLPGVVNAALVEHRIERRGAVPAPESSTGLSQ
ncbi:MAG: chaperone NapD [Acidobacteriota bacterium]|nr:chaperone NapD [Acidobacteriota bacterium]